MPAPAAAELLQALDLLRDLNASGKRMLPEHRGLKSISATEAAAAVLHRTSAHAFVLARIQHLRLRERHRVGDGRGHYSLG
jgi:hypothetical protein